MHHHGKANLPTTLTRPITLTGNSTSAEGAR
jgi:hypothetical protein